MSTLSEAEKLNISKQYSGQNFSGSAIRTATGLLTATANSPINPSEFLTPIKVDFMRARRSRWTKRTQPTTRTVKAHAMVVMMRQPSVETLRAQLDAKHAALMAFQSALYYPLRRWIAPAGAEGRRYVERTDWN